MKLQFALFVLSLSLKVCEPEPQPVVAVNSVVELPTCLTKTYVPGTTYSAGPGFDLGGQYPLTGISNIGLIFQAQNQRPICTTPHYGPDDRGIPTLIGCW